MVYVLAILIFILTFMIIKEFRKMITFWQVNDLRQFAALKMVILFVIQLICAAYVAMHT